MLTIPNNIKINMETSMEQVVISAIRKYLKDGQYNNMSVSPNITVNDVQLELANEITKSIKRYIGSPKIRLLRTTS